MNNLSVNIITYNGASAFIDKTIESVVSYAKEILVWDTGSIDNTCELLTKYPVKVFYRDVQGLGETWTNSKKDIELTEILNELKDFSKEDVILKIDDDEIMPKELMEDIMNLNLIEPIYSLKFLHVGTSIQTHPIKRLFKNIPEVKWEGIYGNETLAYNGKRLSSKKCPILNIPFFHLGGLRQDNDRKHNYNF